MHYSIKLDLNSILNRAELFVIAVCILLLYKNSKYFNKSKIFILVLVYVKCYTIKSAGCWHF